ncbi:MAG: two-component system, OmpR family, response regulator QseB [Actinomycetota bacterium]|jgi:DNA-binding response OmpR family regulator|nr:two-component system, OmpR family, response regulator QseB [Actinomycetota bacterium]
MADSTLRGESSRGHILLIDDEQRILSFVGRGLRAEGFEVDTAMDGATGLRAARDHHYDLVILDLLMPDLHGSAVLRMLLEDKPSQSVLVLSAVTGTSSKVECLDLGAQDYLAKPFSFEELLARVKARLRASSTTTLTAGRITLDLERRAVDLGSGLIPLAEREFLLLRELVKGAGTTISKERLLSAVWGYWFDPRSNVVDVCVRRIRAKLGDNVIATVRGEGYRINAA